MLTGTVVVDLTQSPTERMRHRVACLPEVPTGARVVIHVGALAPEPSVVRVLGVHQNRLHLDVQGMPHAVRRWLDAVRSNMGEVLV